MEMELLFLKGCEKFKRFEIIKGFDFRTITAVIFYLLKKYIFYTLKKIKNERVFRINSSIRIIKNRLELVISKFYSIIRITYILHY